MQPNHWLAEQFETHRRHLHAVALRMLGSNSEADDAMQDTWLRISRADTGGCRQSRWLADHGGRAHRARHAALAQGAARGAAFHTARRRVDAGNPEHEAILADAVGPALMAVLDTLAPAERVAFVLHDMFGMPFEEIAPIVDRHAAAAYKAPRPMTRPISDGDAISLPLFSTPRATADSMHCWHRSTRMRCSRRTMPPSQPVVHARPRVRPE